MLGQSQGPEKLVFRHSWILNDIFFNYYKYIKIVDNSHGPPPADTLMGFDIHQATG